MSSRFSFVGASLLILSIVAPARPDLAVSGSLRVTVGAPTFLSNQQYQNQASVAVSRTGVLAAFYPTDGGKFYRISTDGGLTWGPERAAPPSVVSGGAGTGVALIGGGVIVTTYSNTNISNIRTAISGGPSVPMASPWRAIRRCTPAQGSAFPTEAAMSIS
jgi:hypothetical protein